jgi:hypothetical protein
MATGMGFFERLFSPASMRTELLEELAAIAGRNQGLVERLRRHAEPTPANIKGGVAELAEAEAAHLKVMHAILADHNVWEKLPEAALHDGSNNWARLSGDLEVMRELAADLRGNAMKWEAVDAGIAEKLLRVSIEDEENESELRRLAMKCDALALD